MIAEFLMEKPDSLEEFKRGENVYNRFRVDGSLVFKAILIERLINCRATDRRNSLRNAYCETIDILTETLCFIKKSIFQEYVEI